ncbi:LuxR family transcriptional regulator [Actinomadura sp. HBU206391]|nr:LuxR family transcriptional regulator [Actinomadura sp. HBU206391]
MLSVSRLVTLTGVGGVGKTRIALRVARRLHGAFTDGVWLAELSALQDPELLAHEVSEQLKLADTSTRPHVEVLSDYCADKRLLLVLDTCEHLIDECAALARTLLRAASGLRILATSRQPLNIPGERTLAIAPMRVPDSGPAAARCDAVALFAERAAAVVPGFVLSAGNGDAVAGLCRRLDGIPLAIELAAGRLRVLSVEQIVARLDDRFGLLSGGGRAVPGRHRGLRTAVGWSHELCAPGERLLWARLSVFAGDFDLDAVEAVCCDERLAAGEVLELVSGLVEKSIALREENAAGVRYRLLDTIREYGRDWLDALGERRTMLARHRDHYLRLARRCDEEWCGPDQVEWRARLTREHANLRAALDFCFATPGQVRVGVDLAGTLWVLWAACGLAREGRHYLDRALVLDRSPGPVRAKAVWACGVVAITQGDFDAAETLAAECREHAADGDVAAAARAAHVSGLAAVYRGDLAQGASLSRESAELYRLSDDPGTGPLIVMVNQAMALTMMGDFDGAVTVLEEHRAECEKHGELWTRSYSDYVRGLAELGRGRTASAVSYGRASLGVRRQLGEIVGIAASVDLLAWAAAADGEAHRAARLLGAAHQVWRAIGLPQVGCPELIAARDRSELAARGMVGDRAYDAAFAEGTELTFDEAIAYALGEDGTAARPPGPALLTPREREVAELVAEGLSNRKIAERLYVAKRTVDAHVEHIFAKLGFTSRTQIAAWVTGRRTGAE